MTVNDIVSSIFKKKENQWLSPAEIRETSNYLSDKLGIQRPGDPGRTARMFAQEGYVQKDDNGNCLYNSANLSPEQIAEFSNYEYVYDKISEEDDDFMLEIPIPSNQKLTEDDLGKILADFRNRYGTYGVHYFAVKYARIIQKGKINKRNLIEKSHIEGDSQNWSGELLKGINIYNLAVQDGYLKLSDRNFVREDDQLDKLQTFDSSPQQIIYYGVPGCGKSYEVKKLIREELDNGKFGNENNNVIRTVFHPDYCNADFIGQIIPTFVEKKGEASRIDYRFMPGPFSKILWKAYHNPGQKFFLVIEEINRGNAAAIFGDLFQLLDRFKTGECKGFSEYPVNNYDITHYVFSCKEDSELDEKQEFKLTCNYPEFGQENPKLVSDYDFIEGSGIVLPPNLSILATMNTSDQNVFTLDNAFQRRWDMQLVENKFGDTEEEKNQRNANIEGSNPEITWEKFQTAINNKIGSASSEMGLSSLEDKRLGCWFVKNENGKISKEIFANKVLKYLWDDAFKFSRDKIFENCSNFEELRSKFEHDGLDVFTQDLKSEFCKNKDSETSSE